MRRRHGRSRFPDLLIVGRRIPVFDKFYGFIGGETNQWAPAIFDGTIRVEPPHDPDYHFTVDMTNQALSWMQAQHSLTPDKPFFVYFATGALHAPHHVPKDYIDRYKGKFDQGWDALREETFAKQKQMDVIPAECAVNQATEGNSFLGFSDSRPKETRSAANGDLRPVFPSIPMNRWGVWSMRCKGWAC